MNRACLIAFILTWSATNAFAATPPPPFKMTPQTGHSGQITSLSMTNDERLLISTGAENLIKFWDVRTGKEVRTLDGDNGVNLHSCVLNAKEDSLYCSHQFGKLTSFDVATGKPKGESPIFAELIKISEDRKYLGAVQSNEVQLVDLATQKVLAKLPAAVGFKPSSSLEKNDADCSHGDDCAQVRDLAFSGDAKRLAVAANGTTRIWTWGSNAPPTTLAHLRMAIKVAFSPDGQLVAASDYNGGFGVWNANSGERVVELAPTANTPQNYALLQFTPDSRGLIVALAHELKLLEVGTWKVLSRVETSAKGDSARYFFSMMLSRRTNTLITSDWRSGEIRFFHLPDLQELRSIKNRVGEVLALTFAPVGHRLLVASAPRGWRDELVFTVWNLDMMQVERSFKALAARFSDDGQKLLYSTMTQGIVMDLGTGKIERPREKKPYTADVDFSPDGTKAVMHYTGAFGLYDAETLKQTGALKMDGYRATFLADSKHLLVDLAKDNLRVVDIATNEVSEYRIGGPNFPQLSKWFLSRDRRELFAFAMDRAIAVQDPLTGAVLRRVSLKPNDFGVGDTPTMASDRTGKLFGVIGGYRSTVGSVYDSTTGEVFAMLAGHSSATRGLAISDDGSLIAIGGMDGTVRVWRLQKGTLGPERSVILLQTLTDWLAYTDDGYFDASSNGSNLVGMTQGLSGFNIDQFALRNNRPDVLIERIGGDRDAQTHYKERYLRRLVRAGVDEASLQSGVHIPKAAIKSVNATAESAELKIELADTKLPLKRYNIYVNDVPLFGSEGKALKGKSAKVTERVELTRGMNKIEVSCFNQSGAESYRALTLATSDRTERPELYFLGFGVSKYQNTALNLEFADKDARDLAQAFALMQPHFAQVHVKTWTNEEVTPAAISGAKAILQSAKPSDVVVLFIAGHGMHAVDAEARYYYLTHSADPAALASTAAPFEALEDLLQGIAPRKKLFLMDTCESGERDEKLEQKSLMFASASNLKARAVRGLRIKKEQENATPRGRSYLLHSERFIYNDLLRRSGAIVFSSSRGGEYSFESDKIKNGYFTSEILAAWREQVADANSDGTVSVDELRNFVSRTVAEKTADQQHPTVDRDNLSQKFGFPAQATTKH